MYELTANHAVPDARVNWCYPVASELADAVAHGDGHLTVIMLPDLAVWSRFPRKRDEFESLSNVFRRICPQPGHCFTLGTLHRAPTVSSHSALQLLL